MHKHDLKFFRDFYLESMPWPLVDIRFYGTPGTLE